MCWGSSAKNPSRARCRNWERGSIAPESLSSRATIEARHRSISRRPYATILRTGWSPSGELKRRPCFSRRCSSIRSTSGIPSRSSLRAAAACSCTPLAMPAPGSTALARSFALQPQVGGDRGQCLQAFFSGELEEGASRVVVIGSDSPTIDPTIVVSAFLCLEGRDLVSGRRRTAEFTWSELAVWSRRSSTASIGIARMS